MACDVSTGAIDACRSPAYGIYVLEGNSSRVAPNVQLRPMTSSLFVSFELHSPSANYHAVENAIAALGQAIRVHTYFWYLESELSPQDAAAKLWEAMDERDSVMVVDATHHEAGWKHVSMDVAEFVKAHWRPDGRPAGGREIPRVSVSGPRSRQANPETPKTPSERGAGPAMRQYDIGL